MVGLNAIQLKRALLKMPTDRSVFIWGPPGVGKSTIVRQVATELNAKIKDVRLSLLDPTDLRGLPFLKDGEAVWARPEFLPHVDRDGEKGILFLDEINAAPPATQASAYQLTLDRQVGEYKLPDGWHVWCAGNRESDRAITYTLPSPLKTRLVHLELIVDVDAWKAWAYGKVDPRIIGFISFQNGSLFKFDPTKASRTFPCPRTWEMASQILGAFDTEDDDFVREMLTGCVGEGAAAELLGFIKIAMGLPTAEDIIEKENNFVPTDASQLYAICTSLVNYIVRKDPKGITPKLERLIDYTMKLPEEFSVLTINECAINNRNQLTKAKNWHAWAAKHKKVII